MASAVLAEKRNFRDGLGDRWVGREDIGLPLLERGARPNYIHGLDEVSRDLAQEHPEPEDALPEEAGHTLLSRAIEQELPLLAAALIEAGASLEAGHPDKDPLRMAIRAGHDGLVTRLLEAGTKPRKTPMECDGVLLPEERRNGYLQCKRLAYAGVIIVALMFLLVLAKLIGHPVVWLLLVPGVLVAAVLIHRLPIQQAGE